MSLFSGKTMSAFTMLLVLLLCPLGLPAFADTQDAGDAKASHTKPLFSNKPLALLYLALLPEAGEAIAEQVLFPPNSNMHDYQLSLQDLQKIQKADVIYWYGPAVEPQLAKLKTRFTDKRWLALANSEHAWLSFDNTEVLLQNLAVELEREGVPSAQLDAQKAKVSKQLLSLKAKYKELFKQVSEKKFLLGHSAFASLLAELGLTGVVIYSAGHSHGHHGHGEKDKLAIQQQIARGDITCAVAEPDLSFAQLQRRFKQLTVVELEPMAASEAYTGSGFVTFLEQSLAKLQQCL